MRGKGEEAVGVGRRSKYGGEGGEGGRMFLVKFLLAWVVAIW